MGRLARSHGGRQSKILDLEIDNNKSKFRQCARAGLSHLSQGSDQRTGPKPLSKRFDTVFNIRGSTVTSELGLVALEIDGKGGEVTKAIAWLRAKGVAVEPIEKNVIE